MALLKGLYLLEAASYPLIYGETERRDIARHVHIVAPAQTRESILLNPATLRDVDVIFSGWGAPKLDASLLAHAPRLKAVFYGAGSTGYFTTDAFWDRDITLTSAYAANAIPVAEYTLGAILLSLRGFWAYSAHAKTGGAWGDQTRPMIGGFRSTIGLVGCGMTARRVIELLRPFDLDCVVYDPHLDDYEASRLGVTRGTLEEVFQRSHVTSLHAADKPSTRRMITGALLRSMPRGATFINTARGAIVAEDELVAALRERRDLTAVLDVCHPEPPPRDSPLFGLPNLVLTPHIAGSHDREICRLGRYMVEELERYVRGEPLRWQITRELSARLA